MTTSPRYLRVRAGVRYWEDALVNGVEDTTGTLIPCKTGNLWTPTIDLETGTILDWPQGTTARIHYKVCDAGTYYLCEKPDGPPVRKWAGDYVPDRFLCFGAPGYGDYIIIRVAADGKIQHYHRPYFDPEQWEPLTAAS